VTEIIDTLVCDGKTLRGSIDETSSGAGRFIAQVSLYSNSLGVAIAQNTYATDVCGEIAALRQLLDRVELEGLKEDAHRYREVNGVQIMATLRSLAMNALRLDVRY
jgi:predicted transposase YbfD/YdcC